jgi:hypothetical protein
MQYNDALIQYDQAGISYEGMLSITINETASFSESFSSIIRIAFAEIISVIDTTPIYSRYNDSSLQYDEATATYENYINADASLKKIGTVIGDIATITESFTRIIGVAIAEIITMTESFSSSIRIAFAEVATITESFVSRLGIAIYELVTVSEAMTKSLLTSFSETITITELFTRRIGLIISEVSTITETIATKWLLVISEVATFTETLVASILERLRGMVGIIKEFVRIGNKKEKVSLEKAKTAEIGARENLNDPNIQYDLATVLYDNAGMCYNNFIEASEKPVLISVKNKEVVSLSDKKDKPLISKI